MSLKDKIETKTWDSVRKTINKFRENPYYFFTENDIQAYFYYCLYRSDFEVTRNNKRIYLVHKEYPTNFRYKKDELGCITTSTTYNLDDKEGRRGNYDFGIIDPDYANNAKNVEHIINKNISNLEERYSNDQNDNELLFTLEFKYITSNNKSWIDSIFKDNEKLRYSIQHGSKEAINLVFCNKKYSKYKNLLLEEVIKIPSDVNIIFVQSYYEDNKKITPKPITNNRDKLEEYGVI